MAMKYFWNWSIKRKIMDHFQAFDHIKIILKKIYYETSENIENVKKWQIANDEEYYIIYILPIDFTTNNFIEIYFVQFFHIKRKQIYTRKWSKFGSIAMYGKAFARTTDDAKRFPIWALTFEWIQWSPISWLVLSKETEFSNVWSENCFNFYRHLSPRKRCSIPSDAPCLINLSKYWFSTILYDTILYTWIKDDK